MERKNINRGFKQLRARNDAIELYVISCKILTNFPYELKKTVANCVDGSHSINRNIAEGYSRQSIKSIQKKINDGGWDNTFRKVVKYLNIRYWFSILPIFQSPILPFFHFSNLTIKL